jgi:hypothetical protein
MPSRRWLIAWVAAAAGCTSLTGVNGLYVEPCAGALCDGGASRDDGDGAVPICDGTPCPVPANFVAALLVTPDAPCPPGWASLDINEGVEGTVTCACTCTSGATDCVVKSGHDCSTLDASTPGACLPEGRPYGAVPNEAPCTSTPETKPSVTYGSKGRLCRGGQDTAACVASEGSPSCPSDYPARHVVAARDDKGESPVLGTSACVCEACTDTSSCAGDVIVYSAPLGQSGCITPERSRPASEFFCPSPIAGEESLRYNAQLVPSCIAADASVPERALFAMPVTVVAGESTRDTSDHARGHVMREPGQKRHATPYD